MPDPGSKPQAAADDADDGIDAEVAALIRSGPFETMILDTPPSDFDTAKLLEALTSPYIADDGAGGVALDPHALKKLFSTVSAMLSTMEAEAAEQTAELEQDAESVEDDYRGGLSQHQSTLELLSANLARVDERFRKVTADAVRIGDSLGRKEAQRARAADAIELLEHFKVFDELPEGFADGGGAALAAAARARLPAVFADEDRRMEAARVLSRLRAISFELDAPGLGRAAGNMRAYADFLEAELLDLFERAAGRAPPEAEFMRECADILYALNEGDHLQGRYVYGVVSRRLAHGGAAVAEGGLGAAGGGADQDSLSGLFGKVIDVAHTEFPLIVAVFPPLLAPKVTRLLLQRILSDPVYGIQARVEKVLSPPPPLEPLPVADYLDCLAMVEQQTCALFDLLKVQAGLLAGGEGGEGGDGEEGEGDGGGGKSWAERDPSSAASRQQQATSLMKYLDEQAKHMFYEHREKYAEKETAHLLASLLRLLEGCWAGALELRAVKKAAMAALDSFPAVYLERVTSLDQLLAGPLRAGALRQVFELSTDAVHRCRSIVHDEEAREQRVGAIWTLVCKFMVGHLVIPALRAASQLLPNPVTASSATLKDILGDGPPPLPPRQLYEVVAACTGASRALQEHHRDVVSTGMEGTPTVRTIALETRRSHVQQVEGAAGRVLQKALEMVAAGTERILANRKAKDDYALRDDSAAAMDASRTVKALCALLQDQYALATHCLPGTDMTALWQAVGLCALTLFCDHLKRTRVTVAGAFVLANDVNALRRALGAVGAPRVDAALEDLREVANLFLVPPANLGALMETGRLAAMPRGDLLAYVRQRADYAPAGPGGARAAWARELFGADDAAAALPPEAREIKLGGFKERFAAELGSFASELGQISDRAIGNFSDKAREILR